MSIFGNLCRKIGQLWFRKKTALSHKIIHIKTPQDNPSENKVFTKLSQVGLTYEMGGVPFYDLTRS